MSSKQSSVMQIDPLPETSPRPVVSQLIRRPPANVDDQSPDRLIDQAIVAPDDPAIDRSPGSSAVRPRSRSRHHWPAPPSGRLVGGAYIKPAKSATSVFGAYLFRDQKETLADYQRRYSKERDEEIDMSELVRRALDYYFAYLEETPIAEWQPGEGR